VAGTLAANANNGLLVAGVDWHCRLMPVKVLDGDNYGFYSWWAQGIDFAVANGAKVINLSSGGDLNSAVLTTSIMNAIAQGVIFVTITHNRGENFVRFPGRLAAAITVGATERDGVKTDFSNWGQGIDLVAPGRDIYTVTTAGGITRWWGTLFAAPQVAGAAALLAALRPTINQSELEMLLTLGAIDQGGDELDVAG
jgi:cell wall-associated protease